MKPNTIKTLILSLSLITPGLVLARSSAVKTWHFQGITSTNVPQVESTLSGIPGVKSAKCDVSSETCKIEGARAKEIAKALKNVPGVSLSSRRNSKAPKSM